MMLILGLILAWLASAHAVTILPGGLPKSYTGTGVSTPLEFFTQSVPNAFSEYINDRKNGNVSASPDLDIFMSDRDNIDYFVQDNYHVLPSADSFVRGAIQAWGQHLHLVIQPDEIWLTVLAQINFYLNAEQAGPNSSTTSAYNLLFNETTVLTYYPDWYTIMGALLRAVALRVRSPSWLQDQWISPNFTTTTDEHVMAAHILMLGKTQPYGRKASPVLPALHAHKSCGLPSVTLLGTRQDWAILQQRVEQLAVIFGTASEPAAYGARLLPIMRRFAAAFDDPDSSATRQFWNQMVVAALSSDTSPSAASISGWITALHYWDADGRALGRGSLNHFTTSDNSTYPFIDVSTLPVSYSRTSFVLPRWNDTDDFRVLVLGGPVGKRIDAGAPEGYFEALNRTLHLDVAPWQPAPGNDSNQPDSLEDIHNQTWAQWAETSFGYHAHAHSTLSPLTSWILYGPPGGQSGAPRNETLTKEREWQPEMELETLAAAVLGRFNDTCSSSIDAKAPKIPASRRSPPRKHA